MRILLIDPPFYRFIGFYNRYFPVGLVGLGTVLQQAGHEVTVYDADCNDRPSFIEYTRLPQHFPQYLARLGRPNDPILAEIRETLSRTDPDLIGISIWTAYAASAMRVAQIARELFPDRPIAMGGPHATAKADELLRLAPAVDYVVRGEGERTILELVAQIEAGRGDPASIPGISCRRDGTIHHAPPREKCRNLDEFPFPDRELLLNRDKCTPEDMGLIMTSRGCPYSCTYCATEVGRASYRSVDHILEEIRAVRDIYGTVQFSFKDDSFTVNRNRVEELCDRMIGEAMDIRWECTTRANLVNDRLLQKMKKAGCNSIKIGIESGSERILKEMNKGLTLDQLREAARLFRKAGIYWTGYFMMGVPGETVEEIHQTLSFMYELKPDHASIGSYEPFPGTAMFDQGVRRGLVRAEMTLDDFYTMLPNDYYKADPRRQVDTIEPEDYPRLEAEMKSKFHAYNKSLSRLVKRARSRAGLYVSQPTALAADFRKYLSWR
jgi:anaerobic magnesium-protoporphyrin IX monomethyl ester cyclase